MEAARDACPDCPDVDLLLGCVESAVLIVEPDWTVRSCNRRFLELMGLESEDLRGSKLLSLFSDERSGSEFIALLNGEPPSGDSLAGQCVLARKDGESIALRYRAAQLDGAGPERRRMIIFTGDSRLEKTGERALQSLARLSDENPSPVLRISGDGLLLYANRGSWLLLSHWDTEVGKRIPPVWFELVRGAIRSGQSREEELRIGFKTYLLIIVPVPGMGYVNIFGLDVTARKQVERKLHQDAQVFESASEAIMIMDTDMRILDVNLATRRSPGTRGRKSSARRPRSSSPVGGETATWRRCGNRSRARGAGRGRYGTVGRTARPTRNGSPSAPSSTTREPSRDTSASSRTSRR